MSVVGELQREKNYIEGLNWLLQCRCLTRKMNTCKYQEYDLLYRQVAMSRSGFDLAGLNVEFKSMFESSLKIPLDLSVKHRHQRCKAPSLGKTFFITNICQ